MDVAINHDAVAIAMHMKNHPYTRHYQCDIFEVDPVEACQGRKVGWAHFSPDCKHFSRAKGAKPVSKKIRSLAWVVVQWAAAVKPRIISMENVPEFVTWGPCIALRGRHGRVMKKVTVTVDGKELEQLEEADPGENVPLKLRMLTPRELYNAQGFPPDYEIEVDCYGNAYPKKEQVARCGNAVPPAFATALVRANWPEACCGKEIKTMAELNDAWAV